VTGLPLTPSQTVGPFLAIGLPWPDGSTVVPEGTPGAITITGRLLDGEGAPIPDGLIETWQADPDGRFDHPDDPRGAPENETAFRGRPARTAVTVSSRSGPARCPARMAAGKPRTWMCPCSPVAC
jgi:protocatechuate 3,4-dioxygenase beta subunit